MKTRILAGVILLPLLLAVVLFLPKFCTAIVFGVMAAIGARELLQGTGLVTQSRLVTYAMVMGFFVVLWSSMWSVYSLLLLGVFGFVCMLLVEMLICNKTLPFEKVALIFVAGWLIPFLLGAVVRIYNQLFGRVFILLPFVIAFSSDTFAYFVGCAMGKHKLCPEISPKKTVEGFIGGLLGAVIGVAAYCLVMDKILHLQVNYIYVPVYGILGSLGAVLGDLSFSVIKRQSGIKDYGNLIPGHGGILDRFDSMIVVAPLVELLMLYIPMVVK